MGSTGTHKRSSGVLKGTGSLISVALDFRPVRVEVINTTSRDGALKLDKMADDFSLKTVAAGTRTYAADLVTLKDDGFDLGTDADVNANTEDLMWEAWG